MVEYGRLFISKYLPMNLLPEKMDNLEFEELYRLIAKAEICRELQIDDIAVASNKGIVSSFPDEG